MSILGAFQSFHRCKQFHKPVESGSRTKHKPTGLDRIGAHTTRRHTGPAKWESLSRSQHITLCKYRLQIMVQTTVHTSKNKICYEPDYTLRITTWRQDAWPGHTGCSYTHNDSYRRQQSAWKNCIQAYSKGSRDSRLHTVWKK